jgi:hypothetical protein
MTKNIMDCWNFCVSRILKENHQEYNNSDFIFSEIFQGVSLVSKIWILLIEFWYDVEIIHEHEEIFINLNKDEIPLLNEYKYQLDEFQNRWWKYINSNITIEFLQEKLSDYFCIIPIKKWEWSHLVILNKIDRDTVTLTDNKKWEFIVPRQEFEDLINLYNWKYVLFCKK